MYPYIHSSWGKAWFPVSIFSTKHDFQQPPATDPRRLLLAGQSRPGRFPPAAAATVGLPELGADAQQALHQGGHRMVVGWLDGGMFSG